MVFSQGPCWQERRSLTCSVHLHIHTYIYIYIYFKIFQRLSSYTSYLHGASLHREDRTQGTVVSCQLKPHPQKPAKNRALVWINHCSCQADWPLDMTILRWHSYCRSCLLVIPSMSNQPLPSLPASTAESHPDKQIWWNKGAQMPMLELSALSRLEAQLPLRLQPKNLNLTLKSRASMAHSWCAPYASIGFM